jgi:phage terminase large subunit-like protein
MKLRPIQCEILRMIYDSPTRRAIISMARKNAKTLSSALIVLLHLVGPEARRNSQIYSAAQSRSQAAILFELAAKIVRMSAELSGYVTIRDSAKELVCRELGSVYKALSAEVPTSYGLSPSLVIHDELGQVAGPTSLLYDALETAMGAQQEPLSIVISTQATTDSDLLSLLIDDAASNADERNKLMLKTAPLDDDPWSEKTWRKANPLLGDVLAVEYVRELAETARRLPAKEASFRNLVLNQRINQTARLIPRSVWMACSDEPDPHVLEVGPVWVGLDLSARNDLTAVAYGAQDEARVWHVRVEFFAPEKGVVERSRRDRVPYDVWAREGWITLTPGASVDYEIVAQRLVEICNDFDVSSIAFDRWRMDVLEKELSRLGAELPLVAFGQGFRDMSPAVDTIEAALANEAVRHGGNPVLTMCAANAVASSDHAGNRKLDKAKATGRIDGLVALTMCVHAASMRVPDAVDGPSVYESRGMEEIAL